MKVDTKVIITEMKTAGLELLPIKRCSDGTIKHPENYARYHETGITGDEFWQLYNAGFIHTAILLSKNTGLVCLDFDLKNTPDKTLFDKWCRAVDPDIISKFVIEQTRSGGYHVYYRTPIPGDAVLAKHDGKEVIAVHGNCRRIVYCHPTPGYEEQRGSLAHDLQVIEPDDHALIIEISKSFHDGSVPLGESAPGYSKVYAPVDQKLEPLARRFNQKVSDDAVLGLLEQQGWKVTGPKKINFPNRAVTATQLLRPGGSAAPYSANYLDKHLYVFSSSTGLPTWDQGGLPPAYLVYHYYGEQAAAAMVTLCPDVKDYVADMFPVHPYLPEPLLSCVMAVDEDRARDVLLLSLLTASSAVYGRHRFKHGTGVDLKEYSPHLLCLVAGEAGSGKGMTRYARESVEMVDLQARFHAEREEKAYHDAMLDYRVALKHFEKNGGNLKPAKPAQARKIRFVASASDSTQAGLVETLKHNPHGIFCYDAEIDTLTAADNRKDFGGFSDILRKAFHHENLVRQRKAEGESYEVARPRMAVILAGTPAQVKRLIPDEENGLFSRMIFYTLPDVPVEYRPPNNGPDLLGEAMERLASHFECERPLEDQGPVTWHFSEEQERQLAQAIGSIPEAEQRHGKGIRATMIRLGLIAKRIAVILAAVDGGRGGLLPDKHFQTALAMIPTLKAQAAIALDRVNEKHGRKEVTRDQYEQMKAAKMTDEAISKLLGMSRTTLDKRKKEWETM